MYKGNHSSSVGQCLSHFGSPNKKYIAQALARENLGSVESVYDESPCSAYAGTGVAPGDHPMRSWMRGVRCLGCEGQSVLVVGAETTSTMGGDTYFNVVVRCEPCQMYSSYSDDN